MGVYGFTEKLCVTINAQILITSMRIRVYRLSISTVGQYGY